MYNIAIVEDDDNDAKLLESYIINISEKEHSEYNVIRFRNAIDFLKDYQPIYAVVLLDVEMPNMNGVEASIELRKIDKSCSIIFVTNLIQYAQKGYEVDAVAYLIKPVQYYDFSMKFKKAVAMYSLNEDKDLLVKAGKGIYHISTNKLMFVEVIRHRLYYHLVDEVIEVTGTISKAEEKLKDYGFLKCNQCYLVNPSYISKIQGLELTVGNSILLISRPRKKAFLEELANWYSGVKQ